MKRIFQTALLAALGLCLAGVAVAQPGSGVENSLHNLSASYPGDDLNRVCIFCHAPHNTYKLTEENGGPAAGIGAGPTAPDNYTYLPLWNHDVTTLEFSMYYNGIGAPTTGPKASQAVLNGMDGPGPSSLLCLSCHDGSVAVNAYGNASQLPESIGANNAFVLAGPFQIGKDGYLGNHHPIGFNYDLVTNDDNEIYTPEVASYGAAGFVRDHLYGPGNTQMECSSCHSVHNKGNSGESLLWISDRSSDLCLTCHDK